MGQKMSRLKYTVQSDRLYRQLPTLGARPVTDPLDKNLDLTMTPFERIRQIDEDELEF